MSRLPEFGEAIEAIFGDRLSQLRAIEPGRVTVWNKDEQHANVQPVVLSASGAARAAIPRCAVVFPGAYWDVQVGEVGLLLVCDADYRRWWRSDEDTTPLTNQSHRVGNSVFLPGLRSRANARTIDTDTLVLEKPAAGGEVRLGTQSANRAVVHDRLLAALTTMMVDLAAWVTAVDGAAGPFIPATANLQAEIASMAASLAANDYESPSVKVET